MATRPFQLLALLALRRAWVSRDELAEYLWPGRGQSAALSNLRTALVRAQKLPAMAGLQLQAERLRWLPVSDLQRFEAACAEGRDTEALQAYRPPLLQGMEAGLPEAAADWLRLERQRVASLWRAVAGRRLQALADHPVEAAALAESILAQEPLDDAALLALVEARAALGQAALAMRALDEHARRLADEFGVEPAAALREAARRLRAEPGQAASNPPWRAHEPATRPRPSAGFVGRRLELAEIEAMLLRKDQRLLTLAGPGGIGKSSLARAALQSLAGHFEITAWIALSDIGALDHVPARVGEALRQPLTGAGNPWGKVQAHLGDRSTLLVFDNAEHLPELSVALARLLAACRGLRVLVTSRARLNLESESVLTLQGLPLPDADETDIGLLRLNDAFSLFEDRAKAADSTFDLAPQAADTVRLLHLVEGMPLAIELAAVWVRLLSVAQIAQELAGSADLLDTIPSRPRGLRASFEQSWNLLVPGERAALARLAHLPGTFGREMALEVARAPLPMLASLLDKSLLRAEDGRLWLHPLLRRYAADRADDEEAAALQQRHAAFVANWLAGFLDPAALLASLASMERELPHARAAWSHALTFGDYTLASRCARVLTEFFLIRGLFDDGLALLAAAVERLNGQGPDAVRARAVSLRAQGVLQFHSGLFDAAEHSGREAAVLARRTRDLSTARGSLTVIGNALLFRGRPEDARPYFVQAVRMARSQGDEAFAAAAGTGVGLAERSAGRFQEALGHFEESARVYRRLGVVDGVLNCLNNIGAMHSVQGDMRAALAMFDEGLELARVHGIVSMRPLFLTNAATARIHLGEHAKAREQIDLALREVRNSSAPVVETEAHLAKAQLCAAAGEPEAARAELAIAVATARARQSTSLQLRCVIASGDVRKYLGDEAAAAAAWRWVLGRQEIDQAQRYATQRRLNALPADLPPAQGPAPEDSFDAVLDSIVAGV